MSYFTYSTTEVQSPITSKLPGIRWGKGPKKCWARQSLDFCVQANCDLCLYLYLFLYKIHAISNHARI